MGQVTHLQKLNEKYFDKGLRIVAVTKEGTGIVEDKVVEQRGGKYWVASDPGGETMSSYTQPGRLGIPHAYVIDASGNVVSEGVPSEAKIEELLEATFDPSLGRDLHKALKSVVKTYEKGQFGKAYAAAAKSLENEDNALVADARYLRKRCEDAAAFQQTMIESSIKGKDFASAYADIADAPKAFAGMEIATWAAAKKKELDADESTQTEVKAWSALEKARKKQASAKGKAKKMGPARKAYKSVMKKYPGTRAAKLAESALGSLPSK
jgi:hypothetical protein